MTLDSIAAVVTALGGYLSVKVLYHGDALDRLRDRAHADLVERMVARLRAMGWQVATEVTFNVFGERGSIDILAFHPATGALLVIEVKTRIPDIGGMIATLDRKVRLATGIASERGWKPESVSRLLVVRDDSTSRRRVKAHELTFSVGFPTSGRAVARWLRAPIGSMAGLFFLPSAARDRSRHRSVAAPGQSGAVPRST